MKGIKKWRLQRTSYVPEQVTIFPAGESYVLVEGEDHTSYVGGFFDTPQEAFAWELADAERSIKWAAERKERLLAAQARFNTKGE